MKDVCEFLTRYIMEDNESLNVITKHFKRTVIINGIFHNGNIDAPALPKRLNVDSEQVTITFRKSDYESICSIAYAIDCTPTRTTAILLQHAVCNVKAVNEFVYINMTHELTNGQINELRKVLSYVNRDNDNHSSWASLLSKIVGDVRPATKKLYEIVNEFLKSD